MLSLCVFYDPKAFFHRKKCRRSYSKYRRRTYFIIIDVIPIFTIIFRVRISHLIIYRSSFLTIIILSSSLQIQTRRRRFFLRPAAPFVDDVYLLCAIQFVESDGVFFSWIFFPKRTEVQSRDREKAFLCSGRLVNVRSG